MNQVHRAIQSTLSVTEVQMVLRFRSWVSLPEYPLVTLRGLLGYSLLRFLHPEQGGDDRSIPADSPYRAIFKPDEQVPHPLLIECEPGAGMARALPVTLRFFGTGAQWIPTCLDALEENESRGFGHEKTPYTLEVLGIDAVAAPWHADWPDCDDLHARIELRTPARLKNAGTLIDMEDDIVQVMALAGTRRLRELSECYGEPAIVDFDAVRHDLEQTALHRMAFRLVQDMRTSSRTREQVSIGGLHGWCHIEAPPSIHRIFQAAEWTAIGGKTAAGSGRLRYFPF